MAKISARGATEIGRVIVQAPSSGSTIAARRVFVLCSDGRLLTKFVGEGGTYTLARRGISHPSVPVLRDIVRSMGYELPN